MKNSVINNISAMFYGDNIRSILIIRLVRLENNTWHDIVTHSYNVKNNKDIARLQKRFDQLKEISERI